MWFRKAVQERLNEVSARIENHPKLNHARSEADKAFQAMFPDIDILQIPGFTDWEDKHFIKQGIINEMLYVKGMKDGIQLVMLLLNHSTSSDDETIFGS